MMLQSGVLKGPFHQFHTSVQSKRGLLLILRRQMSTEDVVRVILQSVLESVVERYGQIALFDM